MTESTHAPDPVASASGSAAAGPPPEVWQELNALLQGGPLAPVPDPYPLYARLRRHWPVLRMPDADDGRARFWLLRYDDVRDVLRDDATFSNRVNSRGAGLVMGRTIIEMDGAEHLAHRNLVTPALAPRALRGDFPALVERIANEIIDGFEAQGSADLVPDFTFLYPLRVFVEILGLPPEDVAMFHAWTVKLVLIVKDPPAAFEASREMSAYLLPLIERKRRAPADDLLSKLVTAEVEGQRMTDEEIVSFLRLLVSAGADTTYHLLGSALHVLLNAPELIESVRGSDDEIDALVLETLRYEAPVSTILREATRDCRIGDVDVPEGAELLLQLGAANRDPDHYPEPDRFDIERDPTDHLAFGIGRHYCAGSRLALLEARVGLRVLLDRLPKLHLAAGERSRVIGFAFRGSDRLVVGF